MWQCDQCLVNTNPESTIVCLSCEAVKPGLSEADKQVFHDRKNKELHDTLAKFRGASETSAPAAATPTFVFGVAPAATETSSTVEAPFVPSPTPTASFGWTPGAPSTAADGVTHKSVEKPVKACPTGHAYVHGSGECDQLGLGEGVLERKKPTLIRDCRFTQMAVGSLHSLGVTAEGKVASWGCNDDGALGREAGETGDNVPGAVEIGGSVGRVVRVSAGDSHSLLLDEEGGVWFCGVFKDSTGHLGAPGVAEKTNKQPMKLNGYLGRREKVVEVSSGANHAGILCESGTVYMFGNDEFGQLGSGEREDVSLLDERTVVELRHSMRGKRRIQGKLIPHPTVWEEKRQGKISRVWCTANATYVKTEDGRIYVCGLNNGGQLGLGGGEGTVRSWREHESLSKKKIKKIVGGSFHGVALTEEGRLLTWGRADYCGVGKTSGTVKEPVEVEGVKEVVDIAAGSSHCVACDKYGDVYTWGFGETYQLGNFPRNIENPKEEEPECKDELKPYRVDSKQLKDKFVFSVGAGAQHSVELAWDGEYAEAVSVGISMSAKKRRRESAVVSEEVQPVTKRPKH